MIILILYWDRSSKLQRDLCYSVFHAYDEAHRNIWHRDINFLVQNIDTNNFNVVTNVFTANDIYSLINIETRYLSIVFWFDVFNLPKIVSGEWGCKAPRTSIPTFRSTMWTIQWISRPVVSSRTGHCHPWKSLTRPLARPEIF